MARTHCQNVNAMHDLPSIRQLEAVSFRSFPATSTYYDGTWAIRLTAGHPAKRLNSITPLDPFDNHNISKRLELAMQRFSRFGRPTIFRLSPLAPPELGDYLDAEGWHHLDESVVMSVDLSEIDLSAAIDQLPLRDTGRWVDVVLKLGAGRGSQKPGLVEVVDAIVADVGLFLQETRNGQACSALRCVRDAQWAGLFDLVSSKEFERQGNARSLVLSALKWSKAEGANYAWLQVVGDNLPAISLYQSLGFKELYRYDYRYYPVANV